VKNLLGNIEKYGEQNLKYPLRKAEKTLGKIEKFA
jgi:hypothetical protein